MRKFAALTLSVATVGASWLAMSPAEAHTPNISASCSGVHIGATAYDANVANRWSVTINGATQTGTFPDSFDQTFPVPQNGATTQWSAFVEAADGSFHGDSAGTVGPCGTPVDVCADLPGPQPTGTVCTPPPDVQRSDAKALDGCAVSFGGTSYGAGALTYDEQYTDTYVFNAQTNTFDLVTDTTATIANVAFTPWTLQQQVDHGCTERSPQPPAEHTKESNTRLDCDDEVQVTTTVTTTTPYVYDAATNSWVPGETVKHTTTTTQPVQPGDCDDTEVLPDQTHTSSGTTQVAPVVATVPQAAPAVQIPTAVDAGLAGTAQASVAPVASATPAGDARVPALLMMLAGLALVAGAFRVRRS